MDQQSFELTRRALHGLAELVLAGPQWEQSQDIRLRVTPGGFGTVSAPDLRIDGTFLVTAAERIPLTGTYASIADAAGVTGRDLREVYADGPEVTLDEPVQLDPAAVAVLMDAFARGDAAMRAFAPGEEPVLWPEHFDIGISVAEVNYGVSPGDTHVGAPYAYVGPWTTRVGPFWNMPFGAARPLSQLSDAAAVERYFRKGAERAAKDPGPTPTPA